MDGEAALGGATSTWRNVEPRSLRVRVNGTRLHLLEWGREDAPPVLLVHGMRGHARWFTPVGPALADRYRALSVDLRGHGESEHGGPYGHEVFAEDVAALADALDLARPILVGHSMGGSVCLRAGGRLGPRLRGLALVDTSLRGGPPPRWRRLLRRVRRGLRGTSRRGAPGASPQALASVEDVRRRFVLRPGRSVADRALLDHLAEHAARPLPDGGYAWRFDPDMFRETRRARRRPDPRAIRAPVALIYGSESPIARRSDPAGTAQRFGNAPSLALEVVRGAHHHVFLDRPAAFNAVLRRFLDALPE